jgi:hypothetical protein
VSAEVVDVFVAVHVPFARPGSPLDVDRMRLRYRPTCVTPLGSSAFARSCSARERGVLSA